MNSSLLTRFARQAVRVANKRVPAACVTTLFKGMSTQGKPVEEVPPEDYYDGHLMADHLEYLDDLIDNTMELKQTMEELRTTARSGVKWIEADEIDRLFDETLAKKADITAKLANLKASMEESKKTFAVDAPDGETDGHIQEEMLEINHIIDDAAVLEDQEAILRQRQQQAESLKTFAVDAPDGDSDGHVQEELEEIKHIIDEAAVLENQDAIKYQRKIKDSIRKDRAKDPEHDW